MQFLSRATPSQTMKKIWLLISLNTVMIIVIGFLMIMMSENITQFVLSAGSAVCSVSTILIAGFTTLYVSLLNIHHKDMNQALATVCTGIAMTDNTGKILFANPAAMQICQLHEQHNLFTHITTQIEAECNTQAWLDFVQNLSNTSESTVSLLLANDTRRYKQVLFKAYPFDNKYCWLISDKLSSTDTQNNMIQFSKLFQSYQNVFNLSPMGIVLIDTQAQVVSTNQFFNTLICPNACAIGNNLYDLLEPPHIPSVQTYIVKIIAKQLSQQPVEMLFASNPHKPFSAFISTVTESGQITGLIVHLFDNSAQRDLHMQIVQSQKTQAMGQLAGGIAHDFNNLLTAIMGYCDLLLGRYSPSNQSFTDLMQIKQNSNRAANLVRQLLAYSKQQALQPKIQNVVDILSDLVAILERLAGVNIDIKINYAPQTGLIRVDRGQFEQVIINLLVNARDAMHNEGVIEIKTYNKTFHKKIKTSADTIPDGQYVVIEVKDNGCGISADNLTRIFDPFFSTKEVGQGTGLGLSTVYGIIKQTDGYILVESEAGCGTTFQIMLPYYDPHAAIEPQASNKKLPEHTLVDLSGSGRILLVEDEDAVRLFASRALKEKGYQVVEAHDGVEALAILESAQNNLESFDLIISDVVMPKIDGPTLIQKVKILHPNIKIIFISGYAEDHFRELLKDDEKLIFLPKPFSLKLLAQKVKMALKSE